MAKTEEKPEINELRAKHKALTAQRNDLIKKKQSVIKKREANETNMTAFIAKARQSENDCRAAEKSFLRDELTKGQLVKIKEAHESDVAAMQDAERLRHLSHTVIQEIEREIAELNGGIAAALRRTCKAIQQDLISQLGREEINKKLLEIFLCDKYSGPSDWSGMLANIFPRPQLDEIKKAQAEFCTKNKLQEK